jgi:aspartyl-tRNA(Asn)/glutamyl-tRNA(Gln) amidotransferase subunit A
MPEDINAVFQKALEVLRGLTSGPAREMTLPFTSTETSITAFSETYAYHEPYFLAQPNKYQTMARKQLKNNSENLAAPYIRAMWQMELARRTIDDAFVDIDVIAIPTFHRPPALLRNPTLADFNAPPAAPNTSDAVLMNILGLPAITVPCGFDKLGLPVGLEIAGPHFSEARIMALAAAYQNATQWHMKQPPLTPDTPVPEIP